ncbi:MAG: hypothetical protein AB8C46_10500 [Burkholderiaceae bacterium]
MAKFRSPDIASFLSMTEMFMEERPSIEKDSSFKLDDASHIAVFQDDDGKDVALCYCDWPLAAGLGAALTMIPAAAAEDMASDKELSDLARDNLYEVMNMFSSLFMDNDSAHLKLVEVFPNGTKDVPAIDGDLQTATFKLDPSPYSPGLIGFISN